MRARSFKFLKRIRSAKTTVEACGYLLLARYALKLVHFRYIAPWLYKQTGTQNNLEAIRIQKHVQAAARRLPWKTKCLEQAIASKIMLHRRNISTQINLGVKKENSYLKAHAWLEHEDSENTDYAKFV